MRTYPPSFTYANNASEQYPRFVVCIDFDSEPLYLTSHVGIGGLPSGIIENVLTVNAARSQRIFPDEGRSEIGIVNFDLLDIDGEVTTEFALRRENQIGLRGKKVTLYRGWQGADFSQFHVFQTQIVQSVSYDRGTYRFKCADITREQKKDIFDQKTTRLSATIDASATTIDVASTNGFEPVQHGSSFSDAPDETVGYIQIEDEVIRYTGKTDDQFTGCTRGVLNTRAVAHTVDLNVAQDRRTEVKERIYLELPPPKMIMAIMTGELYGQSGVLPDHWNLGIDPEWVREEDFTGIGTDLWNVAVEELSFSAMFTNLQKTDGKKFLETQLYQLIGCFPLVYSDGTVGIRRMNRVLADAPYIGVLDQTNVKAWSELTYDMESVCNDYQIQWNFDDSGKATRITRLIDGDSISEHGSAAQRTMKFEGLYGSRHTDGTVRTLLNSQRDRYAHPPLLQAMSLMPHLDVLEVGDIMRNRLPLVRDFMAGGGPIDRSMEVQMTSMNPATGQVDVELFGSTGLATTQAPTGSGGEGPLGENVLPDAFYPSRGTELSTVVDMTLVGDVWVTDSGTFAVDGDESMDDETAIYYHEGDLTIDAATLITISQNVQLRVGGFLTINGQIDGVGAGHSGVADTAGYGTSTTGVRGFGSLRAMDGVHATYYGLALNGHVTIAGRKTDGLTHIATQVPNYVLTTIAQSSESDVLGMPTDLRGTSGGPGGKIQRKDGSNKTVVGVGGTGGDSGAGLVIICRGMSFGGSGSIDLSGGDSATPSTESAGGFDYIPGAGAPGCPGALLILMDGPLLSRPDLSGGKFIAVTGASGAPRANTMLTPSGGANGAPFPNLNNLPLEGFLDQALTDAVDMSNSAHNIQYIPAAEDAVADQAAGVPAPTGLAATTTYAGLVILTWTPPDLALIDAIEVYKAATNDRSGASLVDSVKGSTLLHLMAAGTAYFWIRSRRNDQDQTRYSIWEPVSDTGGVTGTAT